MVENHWKSRKNLAKMGRNDQNGYSMIKRSIKDCKKNVETWIKDCRKCFENEEKWSKHSKKKLGKHVKMGLKYENNHWKLKGNIDKNALKIMKIDQKSRKNVENHCNLGRKKMILRKKNTENTSKVAKNITKIYENWAEITKNFWKSSKLSNSLMKMGKRCEKAT